MKKKKKNGDGAKPKNYQPRTLKSKKNSTI